MSTLIKIHEKQVSVEIRDAMWNHEDNRGGVFASRLLVSASLDVTIKDEHGARRAARRWEALVAGFLSELGSEEP